MNPASALRAEAALATFLVEHPDLWPEEEQTVRAAIYVCRIYSVRRK